MLDLHSHILPNVDDGATTIEEAILMAKQAQQSGISQIIATPHHANGLYTNLAGDVVLHTARLNDVLISQGIKVTVYAGQEIRAYASLVDDYHKGDLLTLAGSSYILIELPSTHIPQFMTELLHELKVLRLRPIIAHPERNKEIAKNPDQLLQLIELGAYAQVTSHSLLGDFGSKLASHAWELCKQGWIHLVSNDAHNCGQRGFCLDKAYDLIRSKLGVEWENYFLHNAACIIEDKEFGEPPALATKSFASLRTLTSYFSRRR